MEARGALVTACACLVATAALVSCGPRPVQPAQPGPAAATEAEGPTCGSDEDCRAGEVCRDGTCSPYEGDVGDPCWDDLDCALALRCVSGGCSATIAPDPAP